MFVLNVVSIDFIPCSVQVALLFIEFNLQILMNEVMRSGWTRSCTEFEAKLGTFGPYRLILNTNVNRYPDEGRTRYHEQDGEKLCGPARCKQSRKRVALK